MQREPVFQDVGKVVTYKHEKLAPLFAGPHHPTTIQYVSRAEEGGSMIVYRHIKIVTKSAGNEFTDWWTEVILPSGQLAHAICYTFHAYDPDKE